MVSDVQANDRTSAARRVTLHKKNLGYFTILPEVFVRTQSRNQLEQRLFSAVQEEYTTYLFFCKSGADANDVNDIPLYDADVGEMAPA